MSELKPCPFCGGRGEMIEHSFHNLPSSFGVVCKRCRSQSSQWYDTKEEAADGWNRRWHE